MLQKSQTIVIHIGKFTFKQKTIMKRILYLLLITTLLSCNKKPKNSNKVLTDKEKKELQETETLSTKEGYSLLENNCFICHNPKAASHDNMLAPPLAGIKNKYKKSYPDEELFIAQMTDFVNEPTEENAMMHGPVKRFGLMPKTNLSKTEIEQLVKFIYNNKIEAPEWFAAHYEEQHGKTFKEE